MACTDYEAGRSLASAMLGNMTMMAGPEANSVAGQAEQGPGWTFYTLSVDKAFMRRVAGLPACLPENDIMRMKGATLDQKFSVRLNRQL
ncbi:hypothetical protein [Nitrososphaera sp.]|uniref:hypothetical protein n=1 Tax=Nitrososphaera sp. TaxID=1971748 RepID=UPI002EDB63F9